MSLTEMQFCRIIHELEGRVEHSEQNTVDIDDFKRVIDKLERFEKEIKFTNWFLSSIDLRIDEIIIKVAKLEETSAEFRILKNELQLLGIEIVNTKTRLTKTVEKLEKRISKIEEEVEKVTVKMGELKI